MKKTLVALGALLACYCVNAQDSRSLDLISKSQAESTKFELFEMDGSIDHNLNIDGYNEPREFTVRRGMPNFLRKCEQGKDVTVAFIGGSITQSQDQYRNQTGDYLASLYPNTKMVGVNAGVGGTGSELGACRVERQVMSYKPDLVFVEFAVNGSFEPGVEGIVRKIIKQDPTCDICLIYTIYGGQSEIYGKGEIPANIERLDKVAQHYNLPSIHMGMWSGYLMNEGKLRWTAPKDYKGDKIVFSRDGVHANPAGGDLYAASIARAIKAMKSSKKAQFTTLEEPLFPNQMDRAQYLSPGEALRSAKGWRVEKCSDIPEIRRFRNWFDLIATTEDKNCEPYKFSFKGDFLGIYNFGGPDAGAIDIIIDGQKIVPGWRNHNDKIMGFKFVDRNDPRASLPCFNIYCSIYRSQYECLDLKEGVHDVEIYYHSKPIDKAKIIYDHVKSGKKSSVPLDGKKLPTEYKPQVVRLGWIMINGDPITK